MALVGTGGDELFGGYPTFRVAPMLRTWNRRTRLIPSWLRTQGARLVSRMIAGSGQTTAP